MKYGFKTISLLATAVGLLATLYVVMIFAGNNPDSAAAIPAGVVAVVLLPTAYVTNRLGRR